MIFVLSENDDRSCDGVKGSLRSFASRRSSYSCANGCGDRGSVIKEHCLDRALNQLHRVNYIADGSVSTTIENSKFYLFNLNL
ncbi:MAG TPA: hypothetical protein DD001_03305 [Microcoleaceae bacterium UBA10368]|nr:hypothetical protein [Microcoleaceae cyanobacterium UBA10368]HCV31118.1 hypothetical protein [Microcoleaceae cyanobacterium UBA9251]